MVPYSCVILGVNENAYKIHYMVPDTELKLSKYLASV